ncbi:thioesterase [Muriicola marianensis]|uniref:Thioesterase n=2 Tax=Muriicola marianensis TaxID=1324801 RepID=A0ABQ1R778_9FLAO|nr:thioesterase [Muriicola marianensis]
MGILALNVKDMASPGKFNSFLFFKLPSAWWTGVRLREISEEKAVVTVTHRWINQNPFKSMFWAVQGMAAELSTGALVMNAIRKSGKKVSMLVANNKATFTKKATGKITFTCRDGFRLAQTLDKAIQTGEGQTCWMSATGVNEDGVVVSTFDFEWTLKLKS